MKRYFLLTSVLALAACGGGSGGGSGGVSAPSRLAVTNDAIASNQDITSMSSEILVANDGSTTARSASRHIARSGSIVQDGKTYTSYRLDDVTFKIGGEDSRIRFDVDKEGRIVSVGKYDRSDDFAGAPTYALSEQGKFARKGDTGNKFGKILYMYKISSDDLDYDDGVEEIAYAHFHDGIEFLNDSGNLSNAEIKNTLKAKLRKEINKIKASQKDAVLPDTSDPDYATKYADYQIEHDAYVQNLEKLENAYDTYAARIEGMTSFNNAAAVYADLTVKGVDIGLKYADLGFAELMAKANPADSDANALEHSYSPYVGGYKVLKIDQANLDDDRKFTGTAIAGIDHKRSGYNDGMDVKQEGVLVKQTDAELTVRKDGSSTLVMNNLRNQANTEQKWYNVQIDQAANGLPSFTISGENTITGTKDTTHAAYDLPQAALVDTTKTFTADQWEAYEQNYVDHSDNNYRVSGNAETNVYRLGNDNAHAEATSLFSFGNEYHSDDNVKHNEVAIYGAFGSGSSAPVEP